MKNITVVVEGGLVQSVYSNDPENIRVVVMDLDIEGSEPDDNRIYADTAAITEHEVEPFLSMQDTQQQALSKFLEPEKLHDFLNKSKNYIDSRWHMEDVKQQRPDLTDAQCQEVLEAIEHRHDASIGINWDVIDCVADDLYPEPDNIHELREEYAEA